MANHVPASLTRNPAYLRPLSALSDEFFQMFPAASARPTALRGYMRNHPADFARYEQWVAAGNVLHPNAAHDPATRWVLLDKIGQVRSVLLSKSKHIALDGKVTLSGAADACRMLAAAIKRLAQETSGPSARRLSASEKVTLRKISELVLKLQLTPAEPIPGVTKLYAEQMSDPD